MARVKPVENRSAEDNTLISKAKKYIFLKNQLEFIESEQKGIRTDLFSEIEAAGEEDSKGNVVLELPEEIDGYASVTKQCRVTRNKIDETAAERIITEKGLEDKLYKTVRIVDQDALMAALYNEELTEEEVDEMFPKKVVWALVFNKR